MSLKKIEDTWINWTNKLLGVQINTHRLTVQTPVEYIDKLVKIMNSKWHAKRQTWYVLDMESLTGKLGHISEISPWLRYLLPHLYMSLTNVLGVSKAKIIHTRADFRQILKAA